MPDCLGQNQTDETRYPSPPHPPQRLLEHPAGFPLEIIHSPPTPQRASG